MEHLTLKAVTTPVTDEGVFEAVISTASIDREKDIVEPSAMVAALKKWNRPIPLVWGHSTDPEDIIGSIEPMTVREKDREVIVGGQVDLESKQGAEAWRSFKSGTVGFSYGYMVPEGGSKPRKGGGEHITELDVFEITATPTPMNNDTRVLGWKAAVEDAEAVVPVVEEEPPPASEIRRELDRHKVEEETKDLPEVEPAPSPIEVLSEKVDALTERVERWSADMDEKLKALEPPEEPKGPDSVEQQRLRKEATQAVVGIHSDGVSFSKPPEEPEPEREADWSLRARARREIYELLTED